MRRNRMFAMLTALALLFAALAVPAGAYTPPADEREMAAALNGAWQGNFYLVLTKQTYANDLATINFINDGGNPRMYLTVQSCDSNYVSLNEWRLDGETQTLSFSYNQQPWRADVSLRFGDNARTLTGTYTQYGVEHPLTMTKVSNQPQDLGQRPQFEYESEGTSFSEWSLALQRYRGYAPDGTFIPFTYELNDRSHLKTAIKNLNIDEQMQDQKTDLDKMLAMLNIVCDSFRHDGASGMPEKQDVLSVIRYSEEKGGIECRGLSIILADLLRAYGVPAKSVKCSASDVYSEYCHVVVHAYSRELRQWVMLDPTYRLVLQNEQKQYVSLPMLREALATGARLIPNENAGRNRRPFYMDFYRAYMTKNSFHFSSATNFAYGTDGAPGNTVYTLTPLGYSYAYAYSRGERPTTSSEAFWAAPQV